MRTIRWIFTGVAIVALGSAIGIHRDFVAARLSPGGCADLLAATLLLDVLGEEAS